MILITLHLNKKRRKKFLNLFFSSFQAAMSSRANVPTSSRTDKVLGINRAASITDKDKDKGKDGRIIQGDSATALRPKFTIKANRAMVISPSSISTINDSLLKVDRRRQALRPINRTADRKATTRPAVISSGKHNAEAFRVSAAATQVTNRIVAAISASTRRTTPSNNGISVTSLKRKPARPTHAMAAVTAVISDLRMQKLPTGK